MLRKMVLITFQLIHTGRIWSCSIYLFMQNRLCTGEAGYIAGFSRIRDLWRCHFALLDV